MKILLSVWVLMFSVAVQAAGGGKNEHVVSADVNIRDTASMQRGAQIFVNNCLGCHSAKYMRYERMSKDLEIPVDLTLEHLIFGDEKIGDTMMSAMPSDLSKQWFGTTPPDLSLTGRLRGGDWLYSYLINFYEDDTRPFGVNNRVFEDVGMPHVLGNMERELGPDDYKVAMRDLTNFMVYIAEPIGAERERLGAWVLAYLVVLMIVAYFLNREYWKDVS